MMHRLTQRIAICPSCNNIPKQNLSAFKPDCSLIDNKDAGRNSFYCYNCNKIVITTWKEVEVIL